SRRPVDLQNQARRRLDHACGGDEREQVGRPADRLGSAGVAQLRARLRDGADAMSAGVTQRRGLGALVVIAIPALWLVVLFFVPFLIVLKISLSETAVAQPPYVPVFDIAAGWQGLKDFVSGLSLGSYGTIVSDSLYFTSYLRSLEIATLGTLLLLAIGYP